MRTIAAVLMLLMIFSTPAYAERHPQAGADCASFGGNENLPDESIVQPGSEDDKWWDFTNCGQTTWQGYKVVRVAYRSPETDTAVAQINNMLDYETPAPELAPGETGQTKKVTVHLRMPTEPGRYRIYVEIATPDGHRFGDVAWLEVCVTHC